jgi:hypothetical protein
MGSGEDVQINITLNMGGDKVSLDSGDPGDPGLFAAAKTPKKATGKAAQTKNCKKGILCVGPKGAGCISALKTCRNNQPQTSGTTSKKVKNTTTKPPKATKGGGGGADLSKEIPALDEAGLALAWKDLDRLKSELFELQLDRIIAYGGPGGKYNKILDALEAKNEEVTAVEQSGLKFFSQYREELIRTGLPKKDAEALADAIPVSLQPFADGSKKMSLPANAESVLKEAMTEFYRMTMGGGSDKIKFIGWSDPRGHVDQKTGFFNVGDQFDPALVFHELGHFAEGPAARSRHNAFIRNRGVPPGDLEQLVGYELGEVASKGSGDKFISPYVAKYYGPPLLFKDGYLGWDSYPTEVLSMGLEQFSSPELMLKLYQKDREHFMLTKQYLEEQRQ